MHLFVLDFTIFNWSMYILTDRWRQVELPIDKTVTKGLISLMLQYIRSYMFYMYISVSEDIFGWASNINEYFMHYINISMCDTMIIYFY